MELIDAVVPLGEIDLAADICVPERAKGLVLFAHGTGSSRNSPRNRHVAGVLNRASIGTILIDLLTEEEEAIDAENPLETAALRFDTALLGRRVAAITHWIGRQPALESLGLGYFGASTGAAAALVAAARCPALVRAIVSRGGRPDLAAGSLKRVLTPTLFIVGGEDTVALDFNRWAMAQLPPQTEHKLEIIPDATHLFEEPGTLDRVAALARDWFCEHLAPRTVIRS
jgi:putative phosphoribosyl transferase